MKRGVGPADRSGARFHVRRWDAGHRNVCDWPHVTVDGQSTLVSKSIAGSAGAAVTKLTAEVSTGSRMMSPFAYRRGTSSPINKWVFSDTRLGQVLVRRSGFEAPKILRSDRGGHRRRAICSSADGTVYDVGERHLRFAVPLVAPRVARRSLDDPGGWRPVPAPAWASACTGRLHW